MKIFKKINLKGISLLLLMSLLLCIIPSDNIFADETQYKVVYDDDGNRLYEFWDEESETYSYVNADDYDQELAEKKAEEETEAFYSYCTATIPQTKYYYTGKNIRPKVTVKNKDGVVLKEGTDYTVTYGRYNYYNEYIIPTSTNNARAYDIYIEGKDPYTFTTLLTYYVYVKKTNTVTAKPVTKQPAIYKGKSFAKSLPKLKIGMNTVKIKSATSKNKVEGNYLNCVKYTIPKYGTYAFAFSNLKGADASSLYSIAPRMELYYTKSDYEPLSEENACMKNEWELNDKTNLDDNDVPLGSYYKIFTSNWRSQYEDFMSTTWENYFNTRFPSPELYNKFYYRDRIAAEDELIDYFVTDTASPKDPNRLVCYSTFNKGDIIYITIPNPTKIKWSSSDEIFYKSELMSKKPTKDACSLNIEVKYLSNKPTYYYSSADPTEKKKIKRHEGI